MKNVLLISFLFIANHLLAQFELTNYGKTNNVPFIINQDTLKNPFAGGFNNPQFSTVDLNNDGVLDLFVFDRYANNVKTFINEGDSGKMNYRYAPEYIGMFPSIQNWAMMKDFNCDGKKDIVSKHNYGMKMFSNESDSNNIQFKPIKTFYESFTSPHYKSYVTSYYPIGVKYYSSIYGLSSDIHAFDDLDGDGDLDILTFANSTMLEYHKNMTVETYGSCETRIDTIPFTYKAKCWGRFIEDPFSDSVYLDIPKTWCDYFQRKKTNTPGRHSGGSVLSLDLNGNGLKDLIIGDPGFSSLLAIYNNGVIDSAHINHQERQFPQSDVPVDIKTFPAAFYEDVNNDGIRDLIVASNQPDDTIHGNEIWMYENIGADNFPNFKLKTTNFLVDEMVDVGIGAHPVFFNFNNDSLMDLVVGNVTGYDSSFTFGSGLTLYQNIGTKKYPAFQKVDNDYLGLKKRQSYYTYPAFGDMDGDGDKDLIIGYYDSLEYFENTSPIGTAAQFVKKSVDFDTLALGRKISPHILDFNKDEIPDLVFGKNDGKLIYFEGSGTKFNPIYSNGINGFGGTSFKDITGQGRVTFTAIEIDTAGRFGMYADSSKMNYVLYGIPEKYLILGTYDPDSVTKKFNLIDSIYTGAYSATISVSDFNGDSIADFLIGESGGGFSVYMKGEGIQIKAPAPDTSTVVLNNKKLKSNILRLWPNPADNLISFQSPSTAFKLKIYSTNGKLIVERNYPSDYDEISLNVSSLNTGLYLITLIDAKGNAYKARWVKQ